VARARATTGATGLHGPGLHGPGLHAPPVEILDAATIIRELRTPAAGW
jgi:hypothetical protein